MLIVALILGVFGIIVLAVGVWHLLCKQAVVREATLYKAQSAGFEKKQIGRKKTFYYSCYIPELSKTVQSVCPCFWGDRKELPAEIEVYYNPQVERYCCIKGNRDTELTFVSCLLACIVLVGAAVMLYL